MHNYNFILLTISITEIDTVYRCSVNISSRFIYFRCRYRCRYYEQQSRLTLESFEKRMKYILNSVRSKIIVRIVLYSGSSCDRSSTYPAQTVQHIVEFLRVALQQGGLLLGHVHLMLWQRPLARCGATHHDGSMEETL